MWLVIILYTIAMLSFHSVKLKFNKFAELYLQLCHTYPQYQNGWKKS